MSKKYHSNICPYHFHYEVFFTFYVTEIKNKTENLLFMNVNPVMKQTNKRKKKKKKNAIFFAVPEIRDLVCLFFVGLNEMHFVN